MTRYLKLVRHQNGSWQALPTDTDEALNDSIFENEDAPIDPAHLLKALDPLLFDDGGIKESSATQFSSLMKKFSKKLVSRCVYVNVLTVTKPDVLEKLLDQGGWTTLNGWLNDAKETNNMSLLIRLLELCKLLPMTVERLKENNTPKIVKSLSKFESDDIKALSHELVTKWMTIIKGETSPALENSIKKKKKLKTTKENNKEQKDPKKHGKRESPIKERKDSLSSEDLVENLQELPKSPARVRGLKRTSSDKAMSPENFYSDVKPNVKEEPVLKKSKIERPRKSSEDKSSDSSASEVKAEVKRGSPPKRSRIEKSKNSLNDKTISPELLEDVKIEIKPDPLPKKPKTDRPKTVKSFGAKFRATGLEEAAPLPKKISKKTPTVDKNVAAAVAKSVVSKRLNLFPERITEKKIKPESLLNINELPTPSGGIKLIPAKPKPTHVLHESASFMDALVAQPSAPVIKKKKKPATKPTTPPPTSPPIKPKLQFYKDTLEMNTEEPPNNEEEKDKKDDDNEDGPNEDGPNEDGPKSPSKEGDDSEKDEKPSTPTNDDEATAAEINVEESINKLMRKEEEAVQAKEEEAELMETSILGELKSILSHGKRKQKKSVKWVDDDNLKEMFYFELDETERVNVLRVRPFGDMKSLETRREREAYEAAKRQTGDKMEETMPWWTTPILIETNPPLVDPGCLSQERETQFIRHQSVLQAIYFTRESIPESPQEPDHEIVIAQETKIIPLDEENVVGSIIDYSAQKMPPPKLPEVLSSLISIPLSRSAPIIPNHIDQVPLNTSAGMVQHSPTPMPASPYDPGEPVLHVPHNIAQIKQPPPPIHQQPPMFNSNRFMMEQEPPMAAQNNWGAMDSNIMGPPPPERFFTSGVFPMNPYPMMEPGMPPNGPPMGGNIGMRRIPGNGGGGRMIRPMGRNPPYHPRPSGPRRIAPHVPCRHFVAGGCRFGSSCNFLHPGVNGPAL